MCVVGNTDTYGFDQHCGGDGGLLGKDYSGRD